LTLVFLGLFVGSYQPKGFFRFKGLKLILRSLKLLLEKFNSLILLV